MCCISYRLTKTQVIALTNHFSIKQFLSYQIIRPKCYIEKTTIHSTVSVFEVQYEDWIREIIDFKDTSKTSRDWVTKGVSALRELT